MTALLVLIPRAKYCKMKLDLDDIRELDEIGLNKTSVTLHI